MKLRTDEILNSKDAHEYFEIFTNHMIRTPAEVFIKPWNLNFMYKNVTREFDFVQNYVFKNMEVDLTLLKDTK